MIELPYWLNEEEARRRLQHLERSLQEHYDLTRHSWFDDDLAGINDRIKENLLEHINAYRSFLGMGRWQDG